NSHFLLTYAITAEIIFKDNFLLEHHDQLTRFLVFIPKILGVGHAVNTFPSTPGMWFHVSRKADIVEHLMPVHGEFQIPKRQLGGICWPFFRRQKDRLGHGYT